MCNVARRGRELLAGILGIEPRLDRMAGASDILLREGKPAALLILH